MEPEQCGKTSIFVRVVVMVIFSLVSLFYSSEQLEKLHTMEIRYTFPILSVLFSFAVRRLNRSICVRKVNSCVAQVFN